MVCASGVIFTRDPQYFPNSILYFWTVISKLKISHVYVSLFGFTLIFQSNMAGENESDILKSCVVAAQILCVSASVKAFWNKFQNTYHGCQHFYDETVWVLFVLNGKVIQVKHLKNIYLRFVYSIGASIYKIQGVPKSVPGQILGYIYLYQNKVYKLLLSSERLYHDIRSTANFRIQISKRLVSVGIQRSKTIILTCPCIE